MGIINNTSLIKINLQEENVSWIKYNNKIDNKSGSSYELRTGYFGMVTNFHKWNIDHDNWLLEHGCERQGMALYFPDEQTVALFHLTWS
jgi:hypothetical protein